MLSVCAKTLVAGRWFARNVGIMTILRNPKIPPLRALMPVAEQVTSKVSAPLSLVAACLLSYTALLP